MGRPQEDSDAVQLQDYEPNSAIQPHIEINYYDSTQPTPQANLQGNEYEPAPPPVQPEMSAGPNNNPPPYPPPSPPTIPAGPVQYPPQNPNQPQAYPPQPVQFPPPSPQTNPVYQPAAYPPQMPPAWPTSGYYPSQAAQQGLATQHAYQQAPQPQPQPQAVSFPPQNNMPSLPYNKPTAAAHGIPMMTQQANTEGWNTGLFDCMEDPNNAIITACFPCVTFGQVAEIIDNGHTSCGTSGVLYGLVAGFIGLPCIMSCSYRTKLRAKYGLIETPAPDWITHFFCEWCALCQEYRELQRRGLDPAIGWQGNMMKQNPQVAMLPPMNQKMIP